MSKLAAFVSAMCVSAVALAQDYPAKPIQLIVPFSAGGPSDVVARLYAQHMQTHLGQPVVILNRDGASGNIGTTQAARAAPDGYTLVFGTTSTMVTNALVMKQAPVDFWKEFALIGLIANAPHLLAVRDGLPARSAQELVAMAKANPGKYTVASAGTGTIVHMAAELFRHESGVNLLVVPFKGGAPAAQALLSGDVDMIVNDLTTLQSALASGKLRALAVSHASRLKPLPDVPTFTELGLPGIVSSSWWGIGAPAKTPEPIQARLRAATAKVLAEPDYIARLATMAIEPLVMTPEQSRDFVASEVQKWKTVTGAARIQVD